MGRFLGLLLVPALLGLFQTTLGTAINRADFPEALPVHIAAHVGDVEGVKKALEDKPDSIHAITVANMTALHIGAKFPKVVEVLLKHGAKLDDLDLNKATPLMVASEAGEADSVKLLVEAGANCSLRRADGMTALMLTISPDAWCDTVDHLLKCQADPNMVGQDGYSAIAIATADRSVKCLTKLLAPNFAGTGRLEIDNPIATGQTPLMIAANNHFPTGVHMLLEAGATVAAYDDNGTTPLMHAMNGNSMQSFEEILKLKETMTHLEFENNFGETALMVATRLARGSKFAKKLIDAGADVNAKGGVKDGTAGDNTPLMIATNAKAADTVGMLIDAGADPSLQNTEGYTALHIAATLNLPEICQALLEAGSPQEALTTQKKFTAFGIAVEQGTSSVIEKFREYNGETFTKDQVVAKELTHETFAKEIDGNKALVFFYAPWCEHCKALIPVWEEVARTMESSKSDVILAKVDATKPEIAGVHKVQEFPSVQVFHRNSDMKGTVWKGARYYDALMHVINTQFDRSGGEEDMMPEEVEVSPKVEL